MVEDWAYRKVKVFYPPCREKGTLLGLADHAKPNGEGVWVSYERLSDETGRSIRSIRRDVRILVMRGDLISWCDLDRSRPCNFFYLPLCTETPMELEQRTGISRRQLKLPLVAEKRPEVLVSSDEERVAMLAQSGVRIRPTPRAKVAHPQGHIGPVTVPEQPLNNRISKSFLKEKGTSMNNTQIDRKHDRDAVAEGHSTAGLDILKQMNPKLYEEMQRVGISVKDALATPGRRGLRMLGVPDAIEEEGVSEEGAT